jgi:pilus assembly protein CpaE
MADLKVLIIDSDHFVRQSLRHMIEGLVDAEISGEAAELGSGHRLALHHRPDVIFLEVGEPAETAFELTEKVRMELPECTVIAMAATIRPDLMRQGMRAGVEDLVTRPAEISQIRSALEHALHKKAQRHQSRESRGRIIAVLGVTGGLGTTTIATNLAVALARMEGAGPVLLADFDFSMGSVPSFLDMGVEYTMLELRQERSRLEGEALQQLLPRHRSGAFILAGPSRIEDLDEVSHEDVAGVMDLCRGAFRTIVIDAGHGFDERRMEILDAASVILLVTQLNVAALRNARRALEMLDRFGYDTERMKLVASRVGKGAAVSLADAQRSLGQTFAFAVPNDFPAAINAIDVGVALVDSRRSSRAAASLLGMAQALTADGNDSGKSGMRGMLARLRNKTQTPSRSDDSGPSRPPATKSPVPMPPASRPAGTPAAGNSVPLGPSPGGPRPQPNPTSKGSRPEPGARAASA